MKRRNMRRLKSRCVKRWPTILLLIIGTEALDGIAHDFKDAFVLIEEGLGNFGNIEGFIMPVLNLPAA